MNSLEKIAERRAALLRRAAQERVELGAVCSQFQRPVALFDKGYAMVSQVRAHPGIAMGAAATLAVILVKRGTLGSLIGVATKAARFVAPVARYWLARKTLR